MRYSSAAPLGQHPEQFRQFFDQGIRGDGGSIFNPVRHLDQDALHPHSLRARNIGSQPVTYVGRTLRRYAESIQRGSKDLWVRFGDTRRGRVDTHREVPGKTTQDQAIVHVMGRLDRV